MTQVGIEDILALIRIAEVSSDVESLDKAQPLVQQGLDSLDMMNVFFQIEEKFGISVGEESIAAGQWDTLERIVDSIIKRTA